MERAPDWRVSSSWPRHSMSVRRNSHPWRSAYSTASSTPMTWSFMSSAPRPHTYSSSMWPLKAPCSQSPSVPGTTGTTSMWPMNMTGSREASCPWSVSMSEWSIFSTSAASNTYGKDLRKNSPSSSKAAQSVSSCVGPSTVAMESACARREHAAASFRSA